ncbi:MAG: zinc ABC transporter substrate-binding protein [Ilumatobacteraceae bacterium]|nr:zinc ABC transporter substrate-binding protein [Ilumatobacteraceae bacterium]
MINNRHSWVRILLASSVLFALTACGKDGSASQDADLPQIVVTYSILGSLVSEVVGSAAQVTVLMPNGVDPHEWQPSPKDIETLNNADLVVTNGLGLEGGLEDVISQAVSEKVSVFVATDHIKIREVAEGEGVDPSDADQSVGAQDPHIWMDPMTLIDVVEALVETLALANIDVTEQGAKVTEDLATLDNEVEKLVGEIPETERKLVTGHESLGYFTSRYGFSLTGAVIPGFSSESESAAGELSALKEKIVEQGVKVVFTELGTDRDVVDALARDTGATVVELSTHLLPADGTYRSFMIDLASTIVTALKP